MIFGGYSKISEFALNELMSIQKTGKAANTAPSDQGDENRRPWARARAVAGGAGRSWSVPSLLLAHVEDGEYQ